MPSEEAKALAGLAAEAYRHTGVFLETDKHFLVSSRVRRRCRALGIRSTEEYLELLRSLHTKSEEVQAFIDAVTTHKTFFFRTPSVWDFLRKELVRLSQQRGHFDAWSAACSSGQEPSSIAMLAESVREHSHELMWSVTASDVSGQAVQQAASGRYAPELVAKASADRPDVDVERYFRPEVGGLRRLNSNLRSRIQFKQHNVFHAMEGEFDVVFLRNVLIYFTADDQWQAIQMVRRTLRTGGLLILGESESLLGHDEGLEYLAPCIYRNQK